MNKTLKNFTAWLLFLLACAVLQAEDYRLIITYPQATNEWGRRLASGENKTVMKIQFIDLDDANDYKLSQFSVRPFTNREEWYIDSLQLWKNVDNYPGSLDHRADSLIATQSLIGLDALTTSMTPMSFALGSGLPLQDTTIFFVTMIVQNWSTDAVDDREISDQNGAQIGITVDKNADDIVILRTDNSSGTANDWAGDASKIFTVQAVNLPVYIYNRTRTAEEDSNLFYPRYLELDDSNASRAQSLTDLTVAAHVFLPHDGSVNGDSLSYASFKIGWSNQHLQLDSIAFGDLWDNKQYQDDGWDGSGYGVTTLPGDTTVSVVRFEAVVMGNSSSPENYVDIANNSLGVFYFKVLQPGVSPLFLDDVRILDQWGIPYHCYRTLQNDADDTAEKYDAWVKMILGDFAGGLGTLTDGACDGRIDPVHDVTLFADYFWMNADSADWYSRFDIGDSTSHNPDELSPDDTTNFFDLMVIGTNYYRTLRGDFSQKPVTYTEPPQMHLHISDNKTDREFLQVNLEMENIPELVSGQIKLRFDPQNVAYKGLLSGDWAATPQNVFLYAPGELKKGILDINFLLLEKPISGSGCLLKVAFEKIDSGTDMFRLDHVDLRDRNGQQLAVNIDEQADPVTPADYFLTTCYPNPFNPVVNLNYQIPVKNAGIYRISVYDLQGKLIRELSADYHAAGQYHLVWDGLNGQRMPVSSGIYIVRFDGNGISKNYKITLLR